MRLFSYNYAIPIGSISILRRVRGEFLAGSPKWKKLAYLHLAGCELSDTGRDAMAKLYLQCSVYVDLPLNSVHQRFYAIQRNTAISTADAEADEAKKRLPMPITAVIIRRNGLSRNFLRKIDRCPAELMTPLRRLYELARPLAGKCVGGS